MIERMDITRFYSLGETQIVTELSCPFPEPVFPIAIRRTSLSFFLLLEKCRILVEL